MAYPSTTQHHVTTQHRPTSLHHTEAYAQGYSYVSATGQPNERTQQDQRRRNAQPVDDEERDADALLHHVFRTVAIDGVVDGQSADPLLQRTRWGCVLQKAGGRQVCANARRGGGGRERSFSQSACGQTYGKTGKSEQTGITGHV